MATDKNREKDPIEREEEVVNESASVQEEAIDKKTTDNLTEVDEETDVDELAQLQDKYNELNNTHLRLRAEFDNFRKRT